MRFWSLIAYALKPPCADPECVCVCVCGGGGQGVQTPPPPENHKNIGFLAILAGKAEQMHVSKWDIKGAVKL